MVAAERALATRDVTLGGEWRRLPIVHASRGADHRFVWHALGPETYDAWLGTYLRRPHWDVRFARFRGDVAERAEEWSVQVDPGAAIAGVSHRLPESAPGETLSREDAVGRAIRLVEGRYGLPRDGLREVGAVATRHAARTDWVVTLVDRSPPEPHEGERRVEVAFNGADLGRVRRLVFVPEAWQRAERDDAALVALASPLAAFTITLLVLVGAMAAAVGWSRERFDARMGLTAFAGLLGSGVVVLALGWPGAFAGFSTAQSLMNQGLLFVVGGVVSAGVLAVVLGLTVGGQPHWISPPATVSAARGLTLAVAAGLGGAGLSTVADLRSGAHPGWPSFASASAWWPALHATLSSVPPFVTQVAVVMLIVAGLDRMTSRWTRRRAAASVAVLMLGVAVAGASPEVTWNGHLLRGVLLGVTLLGAYVMLWRHDASLTPITVATVAGVDHVEAMLRGGDRVAAWGSLGSVLIIALVAGLWWWGLRHRHGVGCAVASGPGIV